jgi:hypothetical protein
MAVVRNVTKDVLALFRPDAPPVQPDDSVEIRDENFAGRAWPKSTWTLVKKPGKGYRDASTDDAHLFLPADAGEPAPDAAAEAAADTEEKS